MLQNSITRFRWKQRLSAWQQVDKMLFFLPVALTVFGGIMIRSAELNQGLTEWWQHWLFGGIGLALALLIARSRYELILQWHWIIFGITNLLLIAVIFFGTSAKGAQLWIAIGPFNLQPSEFAKLGLIITLAAVLHATTAATLPMFLKALGVTAIPWLLIFVQPDLGTSLVFGAITIGMLYWANANPGWLLLLVSPVVSAILFTVYLPGWIFFAVIVAVIAWRTLPWSWYGAVGAVGVNFLSGQLGHILWGLLKDYQKDRLIVFINPEKDPLGAGYHLIQSRIAIGAGQLWGKGLYEGTQTQLNFVPEQHTDFIFSVVGEELGLIGGMGVLIVFWLICWRLVVVARTAKDNFGSLLAIGVLSMIVFQVIVSIGMTINLTPVTGIPLPWISYGRSALLTNFLALGVVESVANYRQRLKF